MIFILFQCKQLVEEYFPQLLELLVNELVCNCTIKSINHSCFVCTYVCVCVCVCVWLWVRVGGSVGGCVGGRGLGIILIQTGLTKLIK